jgi:hypothetical protein
MCDQPTIEGLLKAGARAPGFLGLLTDEGSTFFGGHSMSGDQLLKTLGGLSRIWDGRATVQPRATAGAIEAVSAFPLSLHVLFQPILLTQTFGSDILDGQGFLPRVLPAWPMSTMGTRFYRDPSAADLAALDAFTARTVEIADSVRLGRRSPRNLDLSPAAREVLRRFHDEVEAKLGPDGEYRCISGFASKSAEHAARIAGVVTRFEDPDAHQVEEAVMIGACTLTRYYIGEFRHLREAAKAEKAATPAEVLRDWLVGEFQAAQPFSRDRILQKGPTVLRNAAVLDSALDILVRHGWVVALPPKTVVDGKPRAEPYRMALRLPPRTAANRAKPRRASRR